MSSLPPNESLRIYTKNQRLVILSVSESGLRIGTDTDYPTFENTETYLFTENLAVTSDVLARSGFTVATWKLRYTGSSVHVILDASGVKGSVGTGEDPNGQPGGPGGTLGLYVQDLDDDAAQAFVLQARGGGGGDTYSPDGMVGDGGDGGVVISVLQPTYLRVLTFFIALYKRSEFDGSHEQEPITVGDSLYLAAQDLLVVAQCLSASQDTITQILDGLSTELDRIKNGQTRTVADLRSAAGISINALFFRIVTQGNYVKPALDDVRGGYPGAGVDVEVPPGKKGADGERFQTFLDPQNLDLSKAQLPFAHPEQCSMLLDRANTFFYLNSPEFRDHARSLYQRLIERLSFLPLDSSDPLYQAYEDYQQSGIISSTSLADLDSIRASASAQLVQLNAGKTDFYGYAPGWVPRASYTFYNGILDDALKYLESFENAYIKYHAALESQEDLNEQLKLAYSNTAQMISSLDKDIQDLWAGLTDSRIKINEMKPSVQKAQDELKDAYEEVESEIHNAFGLSIPQVIKAFTSIILTPKPGIFGLPTVIYDGFNSVPKVDGGTVTKEYLASQIKQSEATFSNISLELEERIDGTYELDVEFTKRLVVEKEKMLAQLDQFSKQALGSVDDASVRKNLEEKFNAYISAVTARNELILQYNVNVTLILEKTEEKEKYQEEKANLENRQVTQNDPDLPAITAYVDAIYHSSRARVMRLLNVLLRSLNFRMLTSYDVVPFVSVDPDDPDTAPLSLTYIVLTAARGQIEDYFSKQIEIWGSEPARFPPNFDNDAGKRHHLDDDQRQELINAHSVTVSIPPVFQNTRKEDRGDFGGCCNVRVYRARFGFIGLKTASNVEDGEGVRVHVTLKHGGDEITVDRTSTGIKFEHDSISIPYSFRLQNDGSMAVLDNGNINEADIDQIATSYAAPGPFTMWTVDLTNTEFDKLDFSDVTDAFFDFCGTNYAFPML